MGYFRRFSFEDKYWIRSEFAKPHHQEERPLLGRKDEIRLLEDT